MDSIRLSLSQCFAEIITVSLMHGKKYSVELEIAGGNRSSRVDHPVQSLLFDPQSYLK